nr:MAG TPA: hypothetical protein [Caudoviricetes sp.]
MDLDNYQEMLNSKPEAAPQQSNSYNTNKSGWSKEKSSGSKKDDFYKDRNIMPKELDTKWFKPSNNKYFTFTDNGQITEEYTKLLLATCTSLFKKGYIYRSEGNDNNPSDKAIRAIPGAKVEIFKLWPTAKTDADNLPVGSETTTRLAYEVTAAYHNFFSKMEKDIVRCYLARRTQMYLGAKIDSPVDLALCYTGCGCNTFSKTFDIKNARDVVVLFKIAKAANITVFNIKNKDFIKDIKAYIMATDGGEVSIEATQPSRVQEVTITQPVQQPVQPVHTPVTTPNYEVSVPDSPGDLF